MFAINRVAFAEFAAAGRGQDLRFAGLMSRWTTPLRYAALEHELGSDEPAESGLKFVIGKAGYRSQQLV